MIQWNKVIEENMKAKAERAYPFECCGFIIGSHSNDFEIATDLIPADNTHSGEKRRRFYIDPLSYMRAERSAEQKGLSIIGVYHSHPDHPPIPSDEDKRHALPGLHYPIISVKNGSVTSIRNWVLKETREFEETTILKNQ